jgi:hypothetical protein
VATFGPRSRVLVTVLALLLSSQAQRGALTTSRNLSQLATDADTIVRGQVAFARVEPHPQYKNLDTVVVTLKVDGVLKGTAGPTLTFRQFIWDIRDRYESAGYRKGQGVLLFLNRPTAAGLTAPVGLEQGRFTITRDAAGNAAAVNGRDNSGLFESAETWTQPLAGKMSVRTRNLVSQHRRGPVALDSIEEVVRAVTAATVKLQ